jgi:hypothetical protein
MGCWSKKFLGTVMELPEGIEEITKKHRQLRYNNNITPMKVRLV